MSAIFKNRRVRLPYLFSAYAFCSAKTISELSAGEEEVVSPWKHPSPLAGEREFLLSRRGLHGGMLA